MYKSTRAALVAAMLASTLSACANPNAPLLTNADMGTVIGAVAGGAAGARFGAGEGKIGMAIAGTMLGAWAGREITARLTQQDIYAAEQSTQQVLDTYPDRQTGQWSNPNTGVYGTVTPVQTYRTAQGQDCRQYQQSVWIDGRNETANGTACRQPDGSWRIIN